MYIQAIMDLWTMQVFAYALVTEEGVLYQAETPHELYQHMEIAYYREFSPLVMTPPCGMEKSTWDAFISEVTLPGLKMYTEWEDRVLEGERVVLTQDQPVSTQWVRGLNTIEQVEAAKKAGVRCGSGNALDSPYDLQTKENDLLDWA